MGGAHFCARLSAFKVLSLFFCNSIDPSPRFDRAPRDFQISRFAEIFGKDCEVQVTLADSKISNVFKYLYEYIGKLNYYFPASRCYPYCCQKIMDRLDQPELRRQRPDVAILPPNILIIFSFLRCQASP
jgi:hypothetical protein